MKLAPVARWSAVLFLFYWLSSTMSSSSSSHTSAPVNGADIPSFLTVLDVDLSATIMPPPGYIMKFYSAKTVAARPQHIANSYSCFVLMNDTVSKQHLAICKYCLHEASSDSVHVTRMTLHVSKCLKVSDLKKASLRPAVEKGLSLARTGISLPLSLSRARSRSRSLLSFILHLLAISILS
jgi:hypothetical protein